MQDRVESFLAQGNLSFERNFLIVRPAIAGLVALAVAVQGAGFPGRTGVLLACSFAIAYNFLIAGLVFQKRIYLLRAVSLILDNLTVTFASIYVFRQMGLQAYESDLWMLFPTLIVINGLYYGPIGCLIYTTYWTGLFVAISMLFYPDESHFVDQLPMRFLFFVLIGFVSLSLAAELRSRRAKLEQQTRQTLTMLATIVEARDTDAGAHLRHIQHYSRALAQRLGLDDQTTNELAYAAMIHDVGKAQVPDSILKKPGPLTVEERREIQRHTLWGSELLSASEEDFAMAGEVARSHHERWDGEGYPDGLAGTAIPLSARIVAVADVYDALISERPYKKAWPAEDAVAEIKRLRGTHLDPDVVDAFIDLCESGALSAIDALIRDHHTDEAQAA
ncbi:MAG: HD-GYP domain-containing protein [Dehalococcoidia bacterium]